MLDDNVFSAFGVAWQVMVLADWERFKLTEQVTPELRNNSRIEFRQHADETISPKCS